MKRVLSIIFALMLAVSLAACGEEEPAVYEANTEAEVAVAYIYDGQANIATRTLTEKNLTRITLACVYYDITGSQIDSRRLVECQISDGKTVLLWQVECPDMAVYMDSIVYSTEDESGNVTSAKNIDNWEANAVAAFSVEKYQENLSVATSEYAQTAQTNDYVSIADIRWNDPDLSVDLEITGDFQVASVYLFALWFDSDGQPVETNACSYCKNGELMVAHLGTDGVGSYLFTAPEDAHSAKILIQSIVFSDDTQWTNPYCYEWIVHNRSQADES